MAESVTVARPYAEAAFRVAKGAGNLSHWSDALRQLSLVAAERPVVELVGNPNLSTARLSDFFIDLLAIPSGDPIADFVRVLAENDRLLLLPEISTLFDLAKSKEEGVREALVESAAPLDDAQLSVLLPSLEKHFKARLSVRLNVMPELIGGVRVTVGDQVLDTSVSSKLEAMAVALKN